MAGCATNPDHFAYCHVDEYAGKVGEPFGLVTLPLQLQEELRAQLPRERAEEYICWYATGTRIIAANRGGSGVVFVRDGVKWILEDHDPEAALILWWPN